MATANDASGGTTFNFGGAVSKVASISFDTDINPIDTTSLTDNTHVFLSGTPSVECTIELFGTNTSITETVTPASLTITYPDTQTDTIATARVLRKSVNASVDAAITTSITFAPDDQA